MSWWCELPLNNRSRVQLVWFFQEKIGWKLNFRLICEKRLDSLGCAVYSYVVENECTQWFEPSTACANSYQIFKYDALTNMTIAYDNYPIRQYCDCSEAWQRKNWKPHKVFKTSFELFNGSMTTVSHMHAHICIFILFTYAHLKTRGAAHIHLFKWNEQMQKKDTRLVYATIIFEHCKYYIPSKVVSSETIF